LSLATGRSRFSAAQAISGGLRRACRNAAQATRWSIRGGVWSISLTATRRKKLVDWSPRNSRPSSAPLSLIVVRGCQQKPDAAEPRFAIQTVGTSWMMSYYTVPFLHPSIQAGCPSTHIGTLQAIFRMAFLTSTSRQRPENRGSSCLWVCPLPHCPADETPFFQRSFSPCQPLTRHVGQWCSLGPIISCPSASRFYSRLSAHPAVYSQARPVHDTPPHACRVGHPGTERC
jgi:hypothetical protein